MQEPQEEARGVPRRAREGEEHHREGGGGVLESRGADQKLIKSLKKELDVALELEAAAEKRAEYAEKEAAKLKAQSLSSEPKGSLDVLQLEKELEEAHEVIAEFKASWEADRKVIAILSKMKDASPDAPDARDDAKRASEAASESAAKSANLWDLAKKYGKKTLALIGAEEGETPGGEASGFEPATSPPRRSARAPPKRNNTLAAGPGFPASGRGVLARRRIRHHPEAQAKRRNQRGVRRRGREGQAAQVARRRGASHGGGDGVRQAPRRARRARGAPAVAAAPALGVAARARKSPPRRRAARDAVEQRSPRDQGPRNLPERVAAKVGAAPPAAPAEAAAAATPPPAPAAAAPPPRRGGRRRRPSTSRRPSSARAARGCRRRAVHALNRHSAREGGRRAEGRRRRRVERRAPSPGPLDR